MHRAALQAALAAGRPPPGLPAGPLAVAAAGVPRAVSLWGAYVALPAEQRTARVGEAERDEQRAVGSAAVESAAHAPTAHGAQR